MKHGLPITQYEPQKGLLDLSWGQPRPALLPTGAWLAATENALTTYGWRTLAYGSDAGPGPLREWIADRLGHTDRYAAAPSGIFVTAGASHALTLICTVVTRPGDVVFVDSPTYHLAFPIFADHGLDVIGVPVERDGDIDSVDVPALETLISSARERGRRVSMIYIVPTFGNPTSRSLPEPRRHALVELAERAGLTIVEDDTYRELVYDGLPPASLRSLARGDAVVRVGSFAKTVAPGIRLGWIDASPEFVERVSRLGYVHSGGGVNHAAALTMAAFGASGGYDAHVAAVRVEYARQRDALISTLRGTLADPTIPSPAGGWFVWLALPSGLRAADLRPVAERHGVSFVEGTAFYPDHETGYDRVRLSFSLFTPSELAEAAQRLASTIRASN